MKTLNFFKLLLSILFLSLYQTNNAQVAICKQNVIIGTAPWDCTATINVADIDGGSQDFDSLTINQSVFSSLGTYSVVLSAYKNGTAATCTTMIEIVDKIAPVPIIQDQVTIKLNESGDTPLNVADFDNGSYDNCGVITNITLTPASVNCNMINPTIVRMRVYDDAGNWNETLTNVYLSNASNYIPIKCKNQSYVVLDSTESKTIKPSDILYVGPFKCWENYSVSLSLNNVTRPTAEVNFGDIGKIFNVIVTDIQTNETCTSLLEVVSTECSKFNICDTKSRCAPLGDCSSGHTDQDDVEWPCDVTINDAPIDLINNPTSQKLGEFENKPYTEYEPYTFYGGPNCNPNLIVMMKADDVTKINNGVIIRRQWFVLHKVSEQRGAFVQTIKLTNDQFVNSICKPNVTKNVSPWGCSATINVADIDGGTHGYDSLTISQSVFSSLGTYNVVLSAYKNGIAETCTTVVEIVDKNAPIVVLKQDVHIKLNESGETILNVADFDNGSYDHCGAITNITLTPATVNSNTISPIFVSIRVYDESGNWNESWVKTYLSNSVCDICDFLAWDTPLNSCLDGHVDTDAVEWPASFTTTSKNFKPIDFKYDNTVDIRNAFPQMKDECLIKYTIFYNDEFLSQNTDSIVVQRTWNLLNIETNEKYSYVQIVTLLDPYTTEHTFCTRSITGRPINNVNLFSGMDIDDGPCKTFEIDKDTRVTPNKNNTSVFDGVDIADFILINEHILGIKSLSNRQLQAADINSNGKITSFDATFILQLMQGDSSLLFNYNQWKFYLDNYNIDYYNFYNIDIPIPFSTWLTTTDTFSNNYHLVGIKLGDINDSYDDDANRITNVTMDDAILTKGEKSTVKIKATQDLYVDGFQFRIIKNDKIKIDKIKSVFNSGVDMYETNNHTSAISFGNSISGPIFIENKETFIEIEYTALENTVLSQALLFSDGNNKVALDSTLETSNLVFNFGEIISETNDVVNEMITLQPNPASNDISFDGISTQADLEIFTIQGLKIKSETVTDQSKIDISSLAPSMYIAKLQPENSKAQIIRFVKF